MDKSLYEIMKEILEEKKTAFTKDIEFLGTITSDETTPTGKVQVTRDIFMMIDEMPDGTIVQKFYDSDKNFIGGRDKDGKIFPAAEFAMEDLSFLAELEDLSQTQGFSLNEFDSKLEKMAKELGISKEDILAMSEVDLEKATIEKGVPQLSLDEEEENSEETAKFNEQALKNISSKEETSLDNRIDDRHTLADVLGVPAGSKLIAVYSDAIANNKNTTRFSFIIQYPDGTLKPADMLEQVGGRDSDKNVYETNRDGSKVEKQNVLSSYSINSSIVDNGILTARIGSMGYIEIGYGQTDRTSHRDAFTQELETERTRYTTKKVLDEFSLDKGTDNIEDNLDEAKRHEKSGCNDMTLEDADGDLSTGHAHDEALEEIISYDRAILDVFTIGEIEERLQTMSEKYPDDSFEEVVDRTKRDLAEDASRMRGPNMH